MIICSHTVIPETNHSIEEFFDRAKTHDWYCSFSDSYSVCMSGEENYKNLYKEAEKDPIKMKILMAWRDHMFSGESWETEKAPEPKLEDYL